MLTFSSQAADFSPAGSEQVGDCFWPGAPTNDVASSAIPAWHPLARPRIHQVERVLT